MLFQKRIDRAMRYQKERNEAAELKKPTEEDILILFVIAFGCYFLFFH